MQSIIKRGFIFFIVAGLFLSSQSIWSGGKNESAETDVTVITIATNDNWYSPASYSNNLPIFKEIEKELGIKVKWDVLPDHQYKDSMRVRLASGGGDLPDFLRIPSYDEIVKWATEGLIIPLEDILEQHAPNIIKLMDEKPQFRGLWTAPDGHIYHLSQITDDTENPRGLIIRKDWLDKLGLKEPETIDEWYTVLKAFKEQDPNGNGIADEIPFTGAGIRLPFVFGSAWGLHLEKSKGWAGDENNKVKYDYLDPKFKEVLEFVIRLYREGLLDSEFMNLNGDAIYERISRNIVGATVNYYSNLPAYNNTLRNSGIPEAKYIGVIPPEGPYGDRIWEIRDGTSLEFGVSKDSKHSAETIRWVDYVFASQKGIEYCLYGIEGKSYVRENGKIKFTDYAINNSEGLGFFEALRALGAWPNVPYIQTPEAYRFIYRDYPEITEATVKYKPYYVMQFPHILLTAEESEQWSALNTEIDTYRDEMLAKMVMGKESTDKLQEYQNRFYDIGLKQVMQIRQAQWNRYQKSLK